MQAIEEVFYCLFGQRAREMKLVFIFERAQKFNTLDFRIRENR